MASKSQNLSLGLANITLRLKYKKFVTNLSNLFYSLDQKFPINIVNLKETIDISYKYIPEPITKGISLIQDLKHLILSMKMEIIKNI